MPMTAVPATRLAYVDESMRRVDPATLCYFMAGVVVAEGDCEAVRQVLRPIARRSTSRIHWRDEEAAAKERIVRAVTDLAIDCVVVVGVMLDHTKQERARRQVLKHLLFELDQRNVVEATLESRHAERDRFDIRSVGQFRNAKLLSRRMHVTHGRPLQEPLLWLPDIFAGLAGDRRCETNRLSDLVGRLMDLHDLGHI